MIVLLSSLTLQMRKPRPGKVRDASMTSRLGEYKVLCSPLPTLPRDQLSVTNPPPSTRQLANANRWVIRIRD